MSDESSLPYLQKRIAELERSLAEANADAKRRRLENKQLKADLAEITEGFTALDQEHTALQESSQASPDEWQAKYAELEGKVRDRDHKDAFRRLAAEAKVRPEAIDDLYALSGYKAEGDQVDETKLKGLIGEAVTARPYLLSEGVETTPPGGSPPPKAPERLTVAQEASRAARDTGTSRLFVRTSQLRDPSQAKANTKAIADASQKGELTILPD